MSSPESGKEVIHRFLISEIYDRKLQRNSPIIGASQQIIGANAKVEYVSRRHARRIVIVVRCSRGRYPHASGAVLSEGQSAVTNLVGGRRKIAAAEEPHLSLLVSA